MNISKITTTLCSTAKAGAKKAYGLVKQIPQNEAVMKNVKSAAPIAIGCTLGFSLLGFLKNKRRDGKPSKLENASNTLAKAGFAIGAFSKFFKKTETKITKDTLMNIPNVLKNQKLNVASYAIGVVGVGLATTILTKVFDKLTSPKALDEVKK